MIEVYIASAFCKDHKGGNKAGIVFNRPDLTQEQKIKIAKELGFSETAFVTNSKAADYKLEYFTPTEEVPLCGHATIAAFSLLKTLNMLDKDDYTIETKAGILLIKIAENDMVFMEQNCPVYFDFLNADVFENCLEKSFIDRVLPIQIISTGLKDIMLPIDSREHLETLHPNLQLMAELSKEKDLVGVHAFALVNQPDVTAVCRNFAPLYGIDEESATGTSCCALACYLFKYYAQKSQYIFEQGYNLGEISQITVTLTCHDDTIDSVFVGGYGNMIDKQSLII